MALRAVVFDYGMVLTNPPHPEAQEELARMAHEIEGELKGDYYATPEELRAIDEADRSGVASQEEVEAAFRSFRRA